MLNRPKIYGRTKEGLPGIVTGLLKDGTRVDWMDGDKIFFLAAHSEPELEVREMTPEELADWKDEGIQAMEAQSTEPKIEPEEDEESKRVFFENMERAYMQFREQAIAEMNQEESN